MKESLVSDGLPLEESWVGSIGPYHLAVTFLSLPLVVLLTLFLLKRQRDKECPDFKDKPINSVEEIPKHFHFHKWMPYFVEGMYTCFRIRQEGVKVMTPFVKQYGSLFQIAFLWKPVITVQDADLVQKILGLSLPTILHKPRFIYDFVFFDSMRHGLIASDPEVWHPHRKITARCFTYKALPSYLQTINRHADGLLKDFLEVEKTGAPVSGDNLYNRLSAHSIQVVAEVVFGEGGVSEEESELLHDHVQSVKKIFTYRVLRNPLNLILPFWWLNPKKREFDYHHHGIRKLVGEHIERCLKQICMNDGKVEKPFKYLVEEMHDSKCSFQEIRNEATTFLTAGHETLVSVINFLLQLFGENPDKQRLCQEEVDAIFAKKTGPNPEDQYLTMDDMSEAKYLERCITETLRLAPPTPVFYRQLSTPLQVDHYNFKAGTTFAFSPWTLHRDPKYYPDPEAFEPDRWLPEKVLERPAASYLAFSFGPRNCVGQKVAMMEMKVFLAWILRKYDVTTTEKFYDVKIWSDATLQPERCYNITLRKRQAKK